MQLAQISEIAKKNPDQLKEVEYAEELVRHLTQELRTTSYLLHPPLLDETGISSALSWYVQGLAERGSLAIDLKVPDDFGRLPTQIELFIFRLVQECLTNIHRHSGSKTALIRIEREDSTVHVKIEDQGKGMSQERLTAIQSQGTGVGIRGMRERVRHLRGELVIESNDSGTKVYATLPLTTSLSPHKSNPRQVVA
jgi:two-component system, NarL family, sensor kinase